MLIVTHFIRHGLPLHSTFFCNLILIKTSYIKQENNYCTKLEIEKKLTAFISVLNFTTETLLLSGLASLKVFLNSSLYQKKG